MSDNKCKYLECAKATRSLYRALRRLRVPHGWSKDLPSLARLLDRIGGKA